MTTHYETLEVPPNATDAELKSAFRSMAVKWHPDKHTEDKDIAETKFKAINNAYDVLKDPDTRAEYDYSLKNPGFQRQQFHSGPSSPDFNDIFSHVFTNFSGGGFHHVRQQNSDVHINLSVTLEEAFNGAEKFIQYKEHNTLKTINVTIPKGIKSGNTLRLKDKAPKQNMSLPPGSIMVHVHVSNLASNEHGTFILAGDYLAVRHNVSIFDLITGSKVEIKNINGEVITVNIPQGSKHLEVLKIPNKGMPVLNTPLHSELLIELVAEMPTNLPDSVVEKLKKIKQTLKNSNK